MRDTLRRRIRRLFTRMAGLAGTPAQCYACQLCGSTWAELGSRVCERRRSVASIGLLRACSCDGFGTTDDILFPLVYFYRLNGFHISSPYYRTLCCTEARAVFPHTGGFLFPALQGQTPSVLLPALPLPLLLIIFLVLFHYATRCGSSHGSF